MTSPAVDPINLEVFKQLFASVAEEMGVRLQRSSFSPNIKERLDFSCAVLDRRGDIVAQAAHIPVHLGAMHLSVKAVLQRFDPRAMRPTDRFILNDPFAGGTHLPDVTVIAPCFAGDEDQPAFFVASRAHHADVGGKSPGSLPLSTHIDQEGIRIPPSRLDMALTERFCQASRTPQERQGDLLAQLAAAQVGIDRLAEMARRYRLPRLIQLGDALQDYTARCIEQIITDIPDGEYQFSDVLDDDGHGRADIAIRCTLRVTGSRAHVDFSASDDQAPGPINAVRAITVSAANYVFRCLADQDVPSNSGVMRPIQVITQPGSIVDARPPAAVAGGNVETSQRIVDVIFGALAKAAADRIPAASAGTMNNVTAGPADGSVPAFAYYETLAGGAGAGPGQAGGSALQTHMTNTRNTPVEAIEHAYPMQVVRYALRDGSGGWGEHRGGNGLIRRYRFTAAAEVTLLTERRVHPPYGLHGGQPGKPGVNLLIRQGRSPEPLPGKCTLRLEPGDELEIATPGGGGWGGVRSKFE